MTKNQLNLQDAFLNQIRRDKVPVTIYLINGFQIKGIIKGFDNFTAIVEQEGRSQMVYKHAISTIAPVRSINIPSLDNRIEEE